MAALTDPNVAFFLLVLGFLGLLWELHAPGLFLPGLTGVLLVCAAVYGLYSDAPTWYGAALLCGAALLLGLELKFYTHMVAGLAGAILFGLGAVLLLNGPRRISPQIAAGLSVALGGIAIVLGVLAMRARKARPMGGLQELVGAVGVARTAINNHGTVFVGGEYWDARSDRPIEPGKRVRVRSVAEMVLSVEET